MAYWHMQLHPDDKEWYREEELLEKIQLIGVKSDNLFELKTFKDNVLIGDIILIRRYTLPIALVEVIGEFEDSFISSSVDGYSIRDDDYSRLDWFRYRRQIKVLNFIDDGKHDFFQSNKSLVKPIKGKTAYKYIESLHKKISPSFYRSQKGLKLQKLYIQKYKMLNEFNLNFNETITVIAGINGSGKTTLLEYIQKFPSYISDKDDDKSLIEFEMYNEKSNESKLKTLSYSNALSLESKYFDKHIIYFPTGTDIADLKTFLAEYVKKTMHKEDLRPSDVFDRIREQIDKVFQDLEILVKFDKVDSDGNVFFRNKKGEIFSIDGISTGEKTLLSKVLYLYFKDVKNQIILIDEPELSLHPAWQNRVLKLYENFAKENNCQIIIATHSPHIIGSAKNEYIRLLTEDGVIDSFSKSYGLEFSKILTDIMGVDSLRTPDVAKNIKFIKEKIYTNQFQNSIEFKKVWNELESQLGKTDIDLKLLKLEMNLREKKDA